ncbi:MAG TPA: asparagine synthase-related protein [Nitrososphaera sp.]|nr:asparagine synthase-related protein [Nitrososphaera sp.]
MSSHCKELAQMLEASVRRNGCDALLLSGGLDSSILASIARPGYCVTCSYDNQDSPDAPFAQQVAEKFCSRKHVKIIFSSERMLDLVEQAVQLFETFDPIEIRNSVVALAGIEQANADGYGAVMTGDGGDELFAGYNYLSRYFSDPAKLDEEMRRLWKVMHFSSQKIGEHFGVKIMAPYLDSEFMQYAQSLGRELLVGEYQGKKWGKFLLRSCYESAIGAEIAWRPKLAQEQGAGTDGFQSYLNDRIDDLTFANRSATAKREGVILRSKEHLHYYALFRSYFAPPMERDCDYRCPGCQGCMEPGGRFCRTCGAFPVAPIKSL